jgi:hypothetical protein
LLIHFILNEIIIVALFKERHLTAGMLFSCPAKQKILKSIERPFI